MVPKMFEPLRFDYTPILVYHYDMLNIPTIVIENISEANIVPL